MIGGLSWSEISAIRSVPGLNNILLMADAVMTANEFLKEIAKINTIISWGKIFFKLLYFFY